MLDKEQSSNSYGIWYPSKSVAVAKKVTVDAYRDLKPWNQHNMESERKTPGHRRAQKSKALIKVLKFFAL